LRAKRSGQGTEKKAKKTQKKEEERGEMQGNSQRQGGEKSKGVGTSINWEMDYNSEIDLLTLAELLGSIGREITHQAMDKLGGGSRGSRRKRYKWENLKSLHREKIRLGGW